MKSMNWMWKPLLKKGLLAMKGVFRWRMMDTMRSG